MAISGANGLRARVEEYKRKRRAVTVAAEIEIERGPSPAGLIAVGVVALAIAAGMFMLDWRSSNEVSDRAVPVEASVLGGVRYLNSGRIVVDLRFQFAGSAWARSAQLHDPTEVPATLTLWVDPKDPTHSWLPGEQPPGRWGGFMPVAVVGAIGANTCLAMGWKLGKRRRRMGLESAIETHTCPVVVDAVGDVDAVPRVFVIAQTTLGRAFDFAVIFLAVMLIGFAVVWAVESPRMAVFAVLAMAMIVGTTVAGLRWRRRRIVVTDLGFVVRGLFDERQFLWSDIAAAAVVRRQPWWWVLGANRWELHRSYEMVRVEAVLTTHDGGKVPTGLASRVSGWPSTEGPTPRNAAELLVGAWSQNRAGVSPSDSFKWS